MAVSQNEVAQLQSLVEQEKANLANLLCGVKVADLAISNVGNQAIEKAQRIASTKAEVRKSSTQMAKAQHNREVAEQKWKTLQD